MRKKKSEWLLGVTAGRRGAYNEIIEALENGNDVMDQRGCHCGNIHPDDVKAFILERLLAYPTPVK